MRKPPSRPAPVALGSFAVGASLLTVVLTGCLFDSSEDEEWRFPDPEPVAQPKPPAPPPPPTGPIPSGTYQVTSQIDLKAAGVLPWSSAQMLDTLNDFTALPARTLLTLADAAGVPEVAALRAALPDELESRLEGWIDEEIVKLQLNGFPIGAVPGLLAFIVEDRLENLELQSELVLGAGSATHQLKTLSNPSGTSPLGELPDEIVSATAMATAAPSRLTLGAHQFSIGFGEYMWSSIERLSTVLTGYKLRMALGTGIGCPTLAAKIADKCYLDACVGHAAELTKICERGLDEVVDGSRTKIAPIRFTTLRLAAGSANSYGDGTYWSGTWTAELDSGMGPRRASASLTAKP